MKFSLLLAIGLISIDVAPVSGSHPARVERVILFIIDGLANQAPERLPMPHLQKLAGQGCTYCTMHLPLTDAR